MVRKDVPADPAKIADRLRALCSRREYCRADILRKAMDALGGDSVAAAGIADMLVSEKYVDDFRYSSAFARDKSSISGWGTVKIRHALAAKGVGQDVICAALEEIDAVRADMRLEKLMENKLRSLADDPQCRFKMLRFGLGRGYGYDEVSRVIDVLLKRVSQ